MRLSAENRHEVKVHHCCEHALKKRKKQWKLQRAVDSWSMSTDVRGRGFEQKREGGGTYSWLSRVRVRSNLEHEQSEAGRGFNTKNIL